MLDLLPALDTALTVLLLVFTVYKVGEARGKHGIAAPATTGHPDFERTLRVQMNTIEATVMFLPSLWLAVHFSSYTAVVGFIGLAWVAARLWYALAYQREASKRHVPFTLSLLAMMVLLGWGLFGIAHAMWLAA